MKCAQDRTRKFCFLFAQLPPRPSRPTTLCFVGQAKAQRSPLCFSFISFQKKIGGGSNPTPYPTSFKSPVIFLHFLIFSPNIDTGEEKIR